MKIINIEPILDDSQRIITYENGFEEMIQFNQTVTSCLKCFFNRGIKSKQCFFFIYNNTDWVSNCCRKESDGIWEVVE